MKKILIDLLHIQDEAILLDALFDEFNKHDAFDAVYWLIAPNSDSVQAQVALSTDELKQLKTYFYSKNDIISLDDYPHSSSVLAHSDLSNRTLLLPVHSYATLHCILAVNPAPDTSISFLKDNLSSFSYYLILLLDRLLYIRKLNQSNGSLSKLNTQIEAMNQSLSKQLQYEIDKSQKILSEAESLQEQDDVNEMKKEIAHEINNPLSIFKLNIDLLAEQCRTTKLDPLVLNALEQHYNLENDYCHQKLLELELLKPDLVYTDLNKLKHFSDYPKLVDYLSAVLQSQITDNFVTSSIAQFDKLNSTLHTIIKQGIKSSRSKSPVNVNQLIHDVLDLSKQSLANKDIRIHCELPSPPLMIIGKKTRLYQVLINIIKNSLEAMHDGNNNSLTIRCKKVEQNSCEIVISDTGKGGQAPSKTLNLGIGLKIVDSIIKEHQGSIELEPEASGFTVRIRLPIYSTSTEKTV